MNLINKNTEIEKLNQLSDNKPPYIKADFMQLEQGLKKKKKKRLLNGYIICEL